MPNLINRDPPGRLSCIHAFLRSIKYRFGTNSFTGEEAKHKVGGKDNSIDYCTCAKEYSPETALVTGDKKYCPFLRAGSSKSYCYLINSNLLDTQKSKAVGEAIQALEALGLCTRTLNSLKRLRYANLTSAGIEISKYTFFEQQVRAYYNQEIVNYGPIVGFLHFLDMGKGSVLKHSEISRYMGRPNNYDKVTLSTGDEVILNDGDARDARTRTTGALQAWLTYAGYISPTLGKISGTVDSFFETDRYYCNPRNKLGYSKIFLNKSKVRQFFGNMPFVKRPLSYDFFVKGAGAAREYSQRSLSGVQLENLALKEYGSKVRNRRLLLMFSFSLASMQGRGLNLRMLARHSNFRNSPFVVDPDTHEKILLESEADFLIIAGAPFIRSVDNFEVIYPRTKIDIDMLRKENPYLTSSLEKIVSNRMIFV
jgi:hypothetical protein